VGNILSTADALGHTTRYSYDTLNRKVSTTGVIGKTTLLTYDRIGNLWDDGSTDLTIVIATF
jgi:YD repeat-containing protein